jgi:hypothetical protein
MSSWRRLRGGIFYAEPTGGNRNYNPSGQCIEFEKLQREREL